MYQHTHLIGYFAETSVHAGGGESWGAIDLAIQRDKVTQFPIIAGSSLKGSIRAFVEQAGPDSVTETVFGPSDTKRASDHAGAIAFTDARILLFPVRSLKGVYAWVTCPMVLDRFRRDHAGSGNAWAVPAVSRGQVLANKDHVGLNDGSVVIDRYKLNINGEPKLGTELVDAILTIVPGGKAYEMLRSRLMSHLVVVTDEDFTDMVRHATEVQTRIRINQVTGVVDDGALFFQENLPGESLLYGLMMAQRPTGTELGGAKEVAEYLKARIANQTVQMGGDGSVGKGFVTLTFGGLQ
jgi:CRISPR-associated protein Cmr4